jgi:hypothetical protein
MGQGLRDDHQLSFCNPPVWAWSSGNSRILAECQLRGAMSKTAVGQIAQNLLPNINPALGHPIQLSTSNSDHENDPRPPLAAAECLTCRSGRFLLLGGTPKAHPRRVDLLRSSRPGNAIGSSRGSGHARMQHLIRLRGKYGGETGLARGYPSGVDKSSDQSCSVPRTRTNRTRQVDGHNQARGGLNHVRKTGESQP